MNTKTALIGTLFAALTGSPALANTFVESYTSADLIGGAEDSVTTTIQVGKRGSNLEANVGAGYTSLGDQAVIRGEVRYYQEILENTVIEADVAAVYLTGSDVMSVQPEVRVRRYF